MYECSSSVVPLNMNISSLVLRSMNKASLFKFIDWKSQFIHRIFCSKNASTTASIDVLDEFTKNLVTKKQSKWSKKNENEPPLPPYSPNFSIGNEVMRKLNCLAMLRDDQLFIEFSQLTDDQISYLINQALEIEHENDVDHLLEKCFKSQRLISHELLEKLFNNYIKHGAFNKIELLKSYVERLHPVLYKQNACFDHFLAKAYYFNGNTEKALMSFRKCFVDHVTRRNIVIFMVCEIINHVVKNGSEASLVQCIQEAELFSAAYNEHRLLETLWKATWCSGRHSDQCLSRELLDKHDCIKDFLKERAVLLTINSLKYTNDEEAVSRLLQDLLHHEIMKVYGKVLQVLFNYRMRAGDTKGCQEIVKNCKALKIDLPLNHSKYIVMLINSGPAKKKPFSLKF